MRENVVVENHILVKLSEMYKRDGVCIVRHVINQIHPNIKMKIWPIFVVGKLLVMHQKANLHPRYWKYYSQP